MVIGIHGSEFGRGTDINSLTYKFGCLIRAFSQGAVPIFFMISGSFIFSKSTLSLNDIKKRFLAIWVPLVYFSLIYYCYDLIKGQANYHFLTIFRGSWGYTPSANHLWYLFAILPIYTVSPLLKIKVPTKEKDKIIVFIILSIIFFITTSIKTVPFNFKNAYTIDSMFLYMLIGAVIYNIKMTWSPIFFFSLYTVSSIFIWEKYLLDSAYGGYGNLLSFIAIISLFMGFRAIDISKVSQNKMIKFLDKFLILVANNSLKIYGYHMLVLYLLIKITHGVMSQKFILMTMVIITPIISLLISIIDTRVQCQLKNFMKVFLNKTE